ncbi:hypothetical protein [Burkholderia orbicola]|uniref:hypothetical protein n=1 Tax=Burkholderia orbicola TaxID=2978683 RepID=UPI00265040B7|nr:hypothetical protein [Burkholderia orbicola]MDN7558133.1 hypothetical protein [Burkholderia orbicola]
MAIAKPYRRTCRQLIDGSYAQGGHGRYVVHPAYSKSPEHYVRAFLVLQKDLQELFDYVEPSDQNLSCYSYRIHELLMRACMEVEANCKAILTENGVALREYANMTDYRKVEQSHKLSAFQVGVPTWHGKSALRTPFAKWANQAANQPADQKLPWYDTYNNTKHNRTANFHEATFEHMLDAVCAVVAILSAQFRDEDFSNSDALVAVGGSRDGMETAIGGYFRVKFPTWPDGERYDFDWGALEKEADPFANFVYA